ncbi:MAG: winged helix-turn-helix domain-containing protein [Gallionella sp.]
MTRVAIVDADLIEDIASQLNQAGHIATPLRDISSLNAWLATHETTVLLLSQSPGSAPPSSAAIKETASGMDGSHWRLHPAQLELSTPDGRSIPVSPNECCILQAAARANGQLVSRKTLVEALGQRFLHYDERRLESLISRLRRKLSSYAPEGFPVRGVKGCGYLFGVRLQDMSID